jgi:single-stranded DNA-binding protein
MAAVRVEAEAEEKSAVLRVEAVLKAAEVAEAVLKAEKVAVAVRVRQRSSRCQWTDQMRG